jgi:hypothetical protein
VEYKKKLSKASNQTKINRVFSRGGVKGVKSVERWFEGLDGLAWRGFSWRSRGGKYTKRKLGYAVKEKQ